LVSSSARRFCAATLTSVALAVGLSSPNVVAQTPATEEWPIAELKEPSGVVYHAGRKSLFVCGDEGDIAEVSLTGRLLRSQHIGGDLEGITAAPDTGLIYVVREGHEILLEVDPASLKLLRRFNIRRDFGDDAEYLRRGGNGIEGLTFVSDPSHPEGGRFFVVNQDDPAALIELEVPLRSLVGKFGEARIVRSFALSVRPLSGLLWVPEQRRFLVPSALWRAVYVVDEHGKRLASVPVPGLMQEGIARLPDASFVIVQDVGGLIRWKPESDPFASLEDTTGEKR
jgi:uncharacterized protein YjiK